jgi:hypothetical protein
MSRLRSGKRFGKAGRVRLAPSVFDMSAWMTERKIRHLAASKLKSPLPLRLDFKTHILTFKLAKP